MLNKVKSFFNTLIAFICALFGCEYYKYESNMIDNLMLQYDIEELDHGYNNVRVMSAEYAKEFLDKLANDKYVSETSLSKQIMNTHIDMVHTFDDKTKIKFTLIVMDTDAGLYYRNYILECDSEYMKHSTSRFYLQSSEANKYEFGTETKLFVNIEGRKFVINLGIKGIYFTDTNMASFSYVV